MCEPADKYHGQHQEKLHLKKFQDQIREVSDREFAAVPIRTGHPQNEVRLIDVLLRPEVRCV